MVEHRDTWTSLPGTKRNITVAALAVVSLLVIGGLAGCNNEASVAEDDGHLSTATTTATETSKTERSPTSSRSAQAKDVEVPDVVGELLSLAHEELTDSGFDDFDVVPVDGHAAAFNYANWQVTAQDPATGVVSTATEIRLEVVKTDEAESSFCFDGDC